MVVHNPFGDITLSQATLPEFVLARARDLAGKPALVDGPTGRTLTYGELADAVERMAAELGRSGVEQGDVLALSWPNSPEFAVAYLAILAAGAAMTPVSPLATAADVAHQMADCGARGLLTPVELVPPSLAERREPFLSGNTPVPPGPAEAVQGGDLALIPYSSGTTGLPKGVVLCHRSMVVSLCQNATAHRVAEDDVVVAVLPLFHIYGMQMTLNLALRAGATVVTMPRFDLGAFLTTVERYRVTRAELVPPILLALAQAPVVADHDLSSLRVVTCGAAPLSPQVEQVCRDRLGCQVKQGYGMTEFAGGTHIVPDGAPSRPGSIGPPVPGAECKVVDLSSGAELGPGQAGELLIRTPAVMSGYLNNPEATARTVDVEGWLWTGDIAQADEDGWFYVVDRVKDLIKYNGYPVAPAELEAILLTHRAVADAAVVPSPNAETGEVPKAFVVLRGEASEDDLMLYVAERVAPYKQIRRLELVDSIPKSSSGKVLRRVLVERERATQNQPAEAAG
jgi:acyl-CoA synthetase (AMP-forming)/AMP-acid ligase II